MGLRPKRRNGLDQSIPELVSELRATFLTRDFDRVEVALLKRESKLKSHIEDKDKEIGSLKEKIEISRLDRINLESELKRFRDEKHVKKEEIEEAFDFSVGNVCGKCKNYSELKRELDDMKSVIAELRKRNGDLEGERVELLEEKKKWVGEKGVINGLREEKRRAEAAVEIWRRKFCELGERVGKLESGAVNGKLVVDGGGGNIVKKKTDGIDCDGLGKRDEDFGISSRKLPIITSKDGSVPARIRSGMRAVIEIQHSDEDECNLRGSSQRKQTTPQLPGSPGAVQPRNIPIASPREAAIPFLSIYHHYEAIMVGNNNVVGLQAAVVVLDLQVAASAVFDHQRRRQSISNSGIVRVVVAEVLGAAVAEDLEQHISDHQQWWPSRSGGGYLEALATTAFRVAVAVDFGATVAMVERSQ